MKTYKDFHGEIPTSEIGKRLRDIVKKESTAFKILTGYGSTSGVAISKKAALKSLVNMRKQGLISGFLPGEAKHQILLETSPFYQTRQTYAKVLKSDPDFGNDGVIFIFVK